MDAVSVDTGTDGGLTVVLRGEIDFTNAESVLDVIRSGVSRVPPTSIRVAMPEVSFLDSSGIGVLVHVMRLAEDLDVPFRVESPAPKVFEQLRMSGLTEAFGLAED
jgi:anti-sigma B factor antagonist